MSSTTTEQPRGRVWPARAAGGLIVAAFCALVLLGIGWGIPSRERARLEGAGALASMIRRLPPPVLQLLEEDAWKMKPSRGRPPEVPEGMDPRFMTALHRNLFNPIRSYHPDEYQLFKSLSHMNPRRLQFDPGNYIYPTLHTYLVGAAIGVCSLVRAVRLERSLDFYFDHPEQMGRMYLIGRALSLLAATGALLLLWRIGERMQRGVGLLAMALLAAMPALGIHSHNMTRDTCGALAALLLFAACRKLVETGAGKWYDLAGAAAGLCVGFQYFAVVLWGLVPVSAWLAIRRARVSSSSSSNSSASPPGKGKDGRSRTRTTTTTRTIEEPDANAVAPVSGRVVLGRLAASFLVMVAVFALTCPYQVLNVGQFIADFRSETGHVASGGVFARLMALDWPTHLFRMMPAMVTWPLAVAAWAGMLVALVRRREDDWLLLVWLALWGGVVGFDGRDYSRYYVPLLPALALSAARGLAWAYASGLKQRVGGRRGKGRQAAIRDSQSEMARGGKLHLAGAVAVLAVVLGPAAAMSWAWARLYSRENVRTVAGEWIASTLPAGRTIGMTKWPWQFEMPPISPAHYHLVVLGDTPEHSPYDLLRLARLRPEYFVASSLQYGDMNWAESPTLMDLRGAPRAEFFWEMLLRSEGSMYRSAREPFEVPLTLFGRRIGTRGDPEDMQYVNPRIDVLELAELQANARRRESGS